MNVQIIKKNGKPEWVVLPYKDFEKINELLEDIEDIKDIEKYLKSVEDNAEDVIPSEVTFAIIDGTHPIRAWRKYKNIKMNQLASKSGVSSAYLSQIENGNRNPTIETLKAIASALEVELEVLI